MTVPENSYYVLGDNAEYSDDSRYWEDPFVSHEDVIAKLLLPFCLKVKKGTPGFSAHH